MKRLLAGACAAALLAGACSDPIPPTTPSVIQPTITETFNGTLAPLAKNSHPFVVQHEFGGILITLTNSAPKSRLTIAVGTPSTTTGLCISINSVTTDPGSQPQLIGTATVKGPFCIAVSDAGIISGSTEYTVTVLHS